MGRRKKQVDIEEAIDEHKAVETSAFKKLEPLDVPSETVDTTDTSDPPFVPPAAETMQHKHA